MLPGHARGDRDLALRVAFGAWLALASAGCAAPRFADEAGAVAQKQGDPRWQRWVGRYAVRSFLYATDGVLRPIAEQLSLVEIAPRGERLVLEQRLCLYEASVAFLLEGFLRYEFLEDMPPVSAALRLDGMNFDTGWASYALGFEPQPPAACEAADSAPARAEQRWIEGACHCPEQSELGAPPARADDCRASDPDADGKPGATFALAVNRQIWSYQAMQQVKFRYLRGYRRGDDLYADLDSRALTSVVDCEEPDPAGGCSLRDPVPCPPEYNTTKFVAVDEDYDCARVIAERDGLFPGPMPSFPPGCATGE